MKFMDFIKNEEDFLENNLIFYFILKEIDSEKKFCP